MTRRQPHPPHSARSDGTIADAALREFLLSRPTAWLVDELMVAAGTAPVIRARLEQAAGADPVVDVSRYLARLDRVADVGGFVSYGQAPTFAQGFQTELAAVDELRAAGLAAAAIQVLEHAVTLLEGTLGFVDDSDGLVGGVLSDAQQLHAEICVDAQPDPVELAERLARWALRSDWEVFLDSPGTHADALGETGLARFQEIVDNASVGLTMDDEDDEDVHEPSAFTVRYLQAQLAAQRGTDDLVAVLAKFLPCRGLITDAVPRTLTHNPRSRATSSGGTTSRPASRAASRRTAISPSSRSISDS